MRSTKKLAAVSLAAIAIAILLAACGDTEDTTCNGVVLCVDSGIKEDAGEVVEDQDAGETEDAGEAMDAAEQMDAAIAADAPGAVDAGEDARGHP